MKKYWITLFFVILCATTFMSCAGTGDWTYKLPNEYEVWRMNANEILVKYVGEEIGVVGIPSFVKEFAFNGQYVFTRNISDITENDICKEEYYILDTKERKLYDHIMDFDEMKELADVLGTTVPQKWYRTSPDPNIYTNNK